MAYDEGLTERIRMHFHERDDVEEKKMFGGLCYMLSQRMCCGNVKNTLMARTGPDNYEACLNRKHASVMDFTGKTMTGMVYVSPEGIESDADLAQWLTICSDFVDSLPAKKPT